jgi:superfamily II DNA or RNA helicase
VQRIIEEFLNRFKRAIMYSNRRMMVKQLSDSFLEAGIYHGIRASGHEDERDHPFQISSIQTESSRVLKRGSWELHPSDLAVIDEAHLHTGKTARELIDRHVAAGGAVLGVTATPLGLLGIYDNLVVAGNTSQARKCGALVPAYHYGPDEPDIRAMKVAEGVDLSEPQRRKAMGNRPKLFGRVWEWFEKLNPERRPSILFASGVEESIWFAEQFSAKGVSAAHIDGEHIWIDGELVRSSQTIREQIMDRSCDGSIQVLTNRYVLREGIDAPWLAHGIFADIFGSLQTYLQSGGRLLRSHHSLDSVTIQDHGGNWWRHGSLNADRDWDLLFTAPMAYSMRAERIRKGDESEPFRCNQCGQILQRLPCPCGWNPKTLKRSRPVVTVEGELKEMGGKVFRQRRIYGRPNGPKLWEMMYYRSRTDKGARTFSLAAALFARENNWGWPDRSWPLMPIDPRDWYLNVADVPRERLTR